jgi:hypothetical protein
MAMRTNRLKMREREVDFRRRRGGCMRQLLLVIALTLGAAHAQGAALVEIAPREGISFEFVWDISGDGAVLVGACYTPSASYQPCRWSAATGFVLLALPPGIPYFGGPFAMTRDGSSVFGAPDGGRALRWNADGQFEVLPGFPDNVNAVYDASSDGSVLVGQLGSRAFRWKAPGQLELHPEARFARAVSDDGSVTAACCRDVGDPNWGTQQPRPLVWRADGSSTVLPRLHRWGYDVPFGISGDGRHVLLAQDPYVNSWGFGWLWSQRHGQELFVRPFPQAFAPTPFDASTDGSTVVGTNDQYHGESLVWTRASGARRLFDVLAERGVAHGAWDGLAQTIAVSDDGLRMPALARNGYEGVGYYLAVLAPACSDGVDNDGDASADAADADCASPEDDSESLEAGAATAPFAFLLALVPLALVRRRSLAVAASIVLLPVAAGAAGVVALEPRDGVSFDATALSGDGRVLAGACREGSAPARPCRWRLDSGPEFLAWELGLVTQVFDLSWNGSVVVGSHARAGSGNQAVRWLANGDREDLVAPAPQQLLHATHVSADGSVVVGRRWPGGVFRWTEDGGAALVPLAGDALSTSLFTGHDAQGLYFFWLGGPLNRVADLDQGRPFSPADGTPDGSTVVAGAEFLSPRIPMWRAGIGLERLAPSDHPFFLNPWPSAMSDDAATIVGEDEVAGAFVWQAESGLMRLGDFLAVRHHVATAEWDFESATHLSADGRVALVRGLRNGIPAQAVVNLAPACDDGLDNDSDGAVDMADPQCLTPSQRAERRACGLGFEIAFAIAPLAYARGRRRATRTRP